VNTLSGTFPVVVTAIEDITPLIRVFTLMRPDRRPLPAFSGGSHVVVLIPGRGQVFRNAYSLMSSPFDTMSYQIGVRRDQGGRGGSGYLHDEVRVGTMLQVTQPANNFQLNRRSIKHVFLAAGVGITPIIAHIHDLKMGSVPYELHYVVRDASHAGMERFIGQDAIGNARVYHRITGVEVDFDDILTHQPLGSDVYICGPASIIDAGIASARKCGWADSHIHSEIFANASTGDAFEAFLNRTQKRITVPPELSLLEALEGAWTFPICAGVGPAAIAKSRCSRSTARSFIATSG
jgi:ferredoxin-NADP reductase